MLNNVAVGVKGVLFVFFLLLSFLYLSVFYDFAELLFSSLRTVHIDLFQVFSFFVFINFKEPVSSAGMSDGAIMEH
jgi:hypothetical protein